MKNMKIHTSMLFLVLTFMICMPTGCSSMEEKPGADQYSSAENDSDNISAEDTEISGKNDDSKALTDASESESEASNDVEDSKAVTDASESETEVSNDADEWWPKYVSPEEVLKKYMEEQDGALAEDSGYLMYDVNADGCEELIIVNQGRIDEIYGSYKGKLHSAFSAPDGSEVLLYPQGMLKQPAPDSSEYTGTIWQQYYPDFGDYLPVYEERDGEYYTFCAYDLSENDMKEINRSMEDIGEYPVWVGEWFDMLTKKEYDNLVPKTRPVKLLPADAFSDRSALEVKPETLFYVKASDGYANLRTGPGTEYEIICQIPNGDNMEVYRKSALSESGKKWLKVTYFTEADNEDGYTWLTGWVAESQLE